jgi:hypothetical protein
MSVTATVGPTALSAIPHGQVVRCSGVTPEQLDSWSVRVLATIETLLSTRRRQKGDHS